MSDQAANYATWSGPSGAAYAERCIHDVELRARFFRDALPPGLATALELGCGRGTNLAAMRRAQPDLVLAGVEANADAAALAKQVSPATVLVQDALDVVPLTRADLVLTCGFLIHVHPNALSTAYRQLDHLARRYLLVVEYHSPRPREISYRDGATCWARDFAGEFLDAYSAWAPLREGFLWKRRGAFDDCTWFLMGRTT